VGISRHQPDHEHKTTIFGRAMGWLSLLGGIPVLAALALAEGEGGSGDPEGGGSKPPGDGGSGGSGTPSQPFRTFADQKEFDSHANGIKKAAQREAEKAIADQLGCTIDEAKQFLADRKAAEEAALTELQKREQAATKREQDAAAREATAAARERKAAMTLALTASDPPVIASRIQYALNLAMADLPEDADDEVIAATVVRVREAIPEFFGAAPANGTGKPPAPHLGGPPRNNGASQPTGIEAGRERARQLAKARPQPAEGDPFAGLGRAIGS
jgi:hypothetical protein